MKKEMNILKFLLDTKHTRCDIMCYGERFLKYETIVNINGKLIRFGDNSGIFLEMFFGFK